MGVFFVVWQGREITSRQYHAYQEALAPKIEALKSEKLPALEGSEKQIAWATDIRLQKLAELEQRQVCSGPAPMMQWW